MSGLKAVVQFVEMADGLRLRFDYACQHGSSAFWIVGLTSRDIKDYPGIRDTINDGSVEEHKKKTGCACQLSRVEVPA